MKKFAFLSLLIVLSFAQVSHGQVIVVPTEDSTITAHENIGGGNANSVHGFDELVYTVINQGAFFACPIMRFDLSEFGGQIVSDNFVELTLTVGGTHPNHFVHRLIGVHEVLVDWDEATTTWNNFGPTPGPNEGVDYEANQIFVIPDIVQAQTGTEISIILPQNLVQSWIDEPQSNNGLILVTREGISQSDVFFWSREAKNGNAPFIALDLEPRLGDVNCDGVVNLLDVEPFIAAISSGSFNDKADVNQDGAVNLLDITPFVDLLAT